jgi:hypothetical protein
MNRRPFLKVVTVGGLSGLAGCQENPPTESPRGQTPSATVTTPTATPTDTPAETDTPTATEADDSLLWVSTRDGNDDWPGTQDSPLASIQAAVQEAGPGDTIRVRPGEYNHRIKTVRSGEPGNPITVTGPPEAVLRPKGLTGAAVWIRHSHFHVRGLTLDGLSEPDRKFETKDAYVNNLVMLDRGDNFEEGVEYLQDIVVEPHRAGYSSGSLFELNRVRNASFGNFELIGPPGMEMDPRVDDHEEGHAREIFYCGVSAGDIHDDYYPWDDLDRSQNIRIHHVDNSAGYPHSELVDIKVGCSNVTVEYCTDRGAGAQLDGVSAGAISPKGKQCTIRWNDLGDCVTGVEFDPYAPLDEHDVSNWARDNEIYGNYIHDYSNAAIAFLERPEYRPSPEGQRIFCGNRIEGPDADEYAYATGDCGPDVPTTDEIGHLGGDSPWA